MKSYIDRSQHPNFKLGLAASVSDFVQQGVVYEAVTTNFDEMTAGNAMKYASVVADDGTMNFSTVSNFVDVAKAAGITIYGHTDNTGSRTVNERISKERAEAVANFLVGEGISRSRIKTEGLAFDQPIADNSTAEGRALNRRVEIYITANKDMIQKAENGSLN